MFAQPQKRLRDLFLGLHEVRLTGIQEMIRDRVFGLLGRDPINLAPIVGIHSGAVRKSGWQGVHRLEQMLLMESLPFTGRLLDSLVSASMGPRYEAVSVNHILFCSVPPRRAWRSHACSTVDHHPRTTNCSAEQEKVPLLCVQQAPNSKPQTEYRSQKKTPLA